MTTEEIIKGLKCIRARADVSGNVEFWETANEAIKALEQQPCEDAISREDAINVAIDAVDEWDGGCNTSRATMISNAIKDLPSVTPQTRWIPVSERLPEVQDCYLVTTKWKGSYSGDVYIETNMAVYREKPKEWDCNGVIAWMPLPQPYKAESEG